MTKSIYLAWQDQNTRGWHIIGQLVRTGEGFEFRFTMGVNNISSISIIPSMPEHDKVYRSTELFALFRNRLMPKSRPDYLNYLRWVGVNKDHPLVEMETLAISGGERETDFFRIVPIPEKKENGEFAFKFFVNGISHMSEEAKKRIQELQKNDRLYLVHDFQNKEDKLALMLRVDDPHCLIGYIPAYFASAIHKLKQEHEGEDNLCQVQVVQVNKDAPVQMWLLCEFSSPFLNKPWEAYEAEFKLIV